MDRVSAIVLSVCALGCAPDVRIRGQVLAPDGGPVPALHVDIDRGDSATRTDDQGRFEFGLSLDDARYDDVEDQYHAPLSIWVGDLSGAHTRFMFYVEAAGTVDLPPMVEWEGDVFLPTPVVH